MFNPKKLRELRKKARQGQDAVADVLGVTRSTYSMYENGHRQPSVEIVISMSEVFKVSVDFLYDLTDVPYRFADFTSEDMVIIEKLTSCNNITKAYICEALDLSVNL